LSVGHSDDPLHKSCTPEDTERGRASGTVNSSPYWLRGTAPKCAKSRPGSAAFGVARQRAAFTARPAGTRLLYPRDQLALTSQSRPLQTEPAGQQSPGSNCYGWQSGAVAKLRAAILVHANGRVASTTNRRAVVNRTLVAPRRSSSTRCIVRHCFSICSFSCAPPGLQASTAAVSAAAICGPTAATRSRTGEGTHRFTGRMNRT
jgi:hypothetical protein